MTLMLGLGLGCGLESAVLCDVFRPFVRRNEFVEKNLFMEKNLLKIVLKSFRSVLFYPITTVATVSFAILNPWVPVDATSTHWDVSSSGRATEMRLRQADGSDAVEISNISPDVFQCIKEHNANERGYLTFPNGNSGTIDAYADALDIWGGSVDFTYDPTGQTLTINNPQGPGGEQIEEGLRDVARQCINGEFEEA